MRRRHEHVMLSAGRVAGPAGLAMMRHNKTRPEPRSAGYRYPSEIITTAVWLYFRFPLSLRMVPMLVARGITVSYETIRQWGLKFGRDIANNLHRREPRRADKWHLDEVVLTIASKHHYLARGRSRWLRARCPGAEPAGQESG